MSKRVVGVVCDFLSRNPGGWEPSQRCSLTTDGRQLRSYATVVAEWENDSVKVKVGGGVSCTTSKHIGILRRLAGIRGIRVIDEPAKESVV